MDFNGFIKDIEKLETKLTDNETKKFVRAEGKKLLEKTDSRAKEVKRKTGNYHESIKLGKVYKGNDGEITTRVYSGAPHAHLIEEGHALVKKGKQIGFVPGHHVFEKARKDFEEEHERAVDKFLEGIGL